MHNTELWYLNGRLNYIFEHCEDGGCSNLMYYPSTYYTEGEFEAIRSILKDLPGSDMALLAPFKLARAS